MIARWHGQAPRDAILHPVWQPTAAGAPDEDTFVARCLLASGWVGASRRLSMLDLRTWAALCALLRIQISDAAADDPTLDSAALRTVTTTGYQLADMVLADDGGQTYRKLERSLGRLAGTTVIVDRVDADPELVAQRVTRGLVRLLGDVWIATDELGLRTPTQWGALKGSMSLRVEIGHWTAQQILAGRTCWLDLDLLRALGPGLPGRVWALCEAWGRWPARSLDGCEETAIGLGEPALQSLGVGQYERAHSARRALDRAGERICAADPSYGLVRCQKRAGWCLVVRRISGPRARAQARSGAGWRSQGIAATKRERPERAKIHAAARESLATAQRKRP